MNTSAPNTFKDLKLVLERYCAYQERCHYDVKQKMYRLNVSPKFKDALLVHLIEHDFLNEERFAMAYIRGKHKIKKWGRQRLKSELRRRDISKYIIDKALKSIDETEYLEMFNELSHSKLKTLASYPVIKQKRKLADYLIYRGWESHLVYDKVNELINN